MELRVQMHQDAFPRLPLQEGASAPAEATAAELRSQEGLELSAPSGSKRKRKPAPPMSLESGDREAPSRAHSNTSARLISSPGSFGAEDVRELNDMLDKMFVQREAAGPQGQTLVKNLAEVGGGSL